MIGQGAATLKEGGQKVGRLGGQMAAAARQVFGDAAIAEHELFLQRRQAGFYSPTLGALRADFEGGRRVHAALVWAART